MRERGIERKRKRKRGRERGKKRKRDGEWREEKRDVFMYT